MHPNTIINTRVLGAINQGEDLAELLNGLSRTHAKCRDLFGPAIAMITHCYLVARDGGHIASEPDQALAEFLSGSLARMLFELTVSVNTDGELASRQISAMVSAINACRQAGCKWTVPEYHPAPIPVAVLSLPERVTSTEIRRDLKTNTITGSMQIETDKAH